jgi:hypothetical protein
MHEWANRFYIATHFYLLSLPMNGITNLLQLLQRDKQVLTVDALLVYEECLLKVL